MTADARLHSVSPGAFNQRASGMGITGLGNAAASDGLAARSLAGDQAEIGHELARACKACEIANFSDQHHGCDQSDTPHRLQGVNNWAQIPFGKEIGYLLLDSLKAPLRIHDGIDIVLKCDLLRGMFEGQSR